MGKPWLLKIAVSLWVTFLGAPPLGAAPAHTHQEKVLDQVGVDEKLSSQVPLDISFTDQSGKRVRLAHYFTGTPVILTLNYYTCPTLCPVVFRNLVGSMKEVKGLSFGDDYRIVTVSINPEESFAAARDKSSTTYAMLGKVPLAAEKWPFLRGAQGDIERLSRAVRVRYAKVGDEFADPNVMVVLTPGGRVSRYLYGVETHPRDLKISLIEAAGGKIGASEIVNRALLYCFHYDPVGKKYELIASRVMMAGMTLVLLMVVVLLAVMWQRERKNPGT